MTVEQLIERLSELDPNWEVQATTSGRSIWVGEPGPWRAGRRYGLVFTDGSPTRLLTDRSSK